MTDHISAPRVRLSPAKLGEIAAATDAYNFHSHTQFCDGRASMEDMAQAALSLGMEHYGFSPHSPVVCESGANMKSVDVQPYLTEARRIALELEGQMAIYAGMEIDYLGPGWGAHIPYFQDLPLDYRIGSVHFVRTRRGEYVDCDGKPERFKRYVRDYFAGDLRYVVEKFFDATLEMIGRGGFDILGHADKIGRNASFVDATVERENWYIRWMTEVVDAAIETGVAVEINTKAYAETNRMFPAQRWWKPLIEAQVPLLVNSDAHWPDKITAGRDAALAMLREMRGE